MKVLLEECLPLDCRHELGGHDADTVQLRFPAARRLSVVLLRSATNQFADLQSLMKPLLEVLANITPGRIVKIEYSARHVLWCWAIRRCNLFLRACERPLNASSAFRTVAVTP